MNIPLYKMHSTQKDIDAVSDVIKRQTYWACGPEIEEFEHQLAKYLGSKYVVTFNSGTTALYSLLIAHKLQECEIIVPSFTFIATANCVKLASSKPVFADIESDTFGLNADSIREKITDKTKAIIPVHYGGHCCWDMDYITEVAEDYDLLVLEDAAESFGAKHKHQCVGTMGDGAMFSLCQTKTLQTGEGGFITTDDEEIYYRLKLLRSHGRTEGSNYFTTPIPPEYVSLGFNFRIPTITAALGLSQLSELHHILQKRRYFAQRYNDGLDILPLQLPSEKLNYTHVYQMYTIMCYNQKTRDALQTHLSKNNIASKVYFEPVHRCQYYYNQGYDETLPVTEETSKRVLTLPLYPSLTDEESDYVVKTIQEFFNEKN